MTVLFFDDIRKSKEIIVNKLSTSKLKKIQIIKDTVKKIFMVLFIIFSFIIVFIGKPDNFIIQNTSGLIIDIMSPFIKVVSYPFNFIGTIYNNVKEFNNIKDINNKLYEEISELREQIVTLKSIESEYKHLKIKDNFIYNEVKTLLSTRVIYSSGSGFTNSFILGAGSKNGVMKYQGVLVDGNLVGQIVSVGENYSRMLLVTDANSKIPVQIDRTGTRAFLVGNNSNYPQIIHFENQESVQIGDMVITSGLNNNIPVGIPVGIIGSISDDGILVQPYINKSNIDYVKIIKTSHADGVNNFLLNNL